MNQAFFQESLSSKFYEILKPLLSENGQFSSDYHYHLKRLQEFEKQLSHIETLFGDLYQRTAALEKVVKNLNAERTI
jgi:hypothetical protein